MLLSYSTLYLHIDSFFPEVKNGKATGHFVANMPDTAENRLKLFDAILRGLVQPSDIEICSRISLRVLSGEYFSLTVSEKIND